MTKIALERTSTGVTHHVAGQVLVASEGFAAEAAAEGGCFAGLHGRVVRELVTLETVEGGEETPALRAAVHPLAAFCVACLPLVPLTRMALKNNNENKGVRYSLGFLNMGSIRGPCYEGWVCVTTRFS